MSEWAPKRFWQNTAVQTAGNGYTVTLDGRELRTPSKTLLTVPSRALAEAVAAEWQAQDERIDPNTMPFTRTANTTIDKVAPQRAAVADMLAAYGDADLLCYRADQPDALVMRQRLGWDPMLDWASDRFGARLEPRIGVMHVAQDPEALDVLAAEVHALDEHRLTAFHDLVALSGSLVLGLAVAHEVAPSSEIWAISRIDEDWQAEQWGADDEAANAAAIKAEAFEHANRYYRMIGLT